MNKEWVETAMRLADEYASLHYNSTDHIELQARGALEAHLNTLNPDQAKRGGNTAGGSCSTTGTGWGQGARGGGTGYAVRSGYVTGSASAGTVAEDQAPASSGTAALLPKASDFAQARYVLSSGEMYWSPQGDWIRFAAMENVLATLAETQRPQETQRLDVPESPGVLAALQELFEIANEIHGVFDEQTYEEKRRADFDTPDDHEHTITITAKQERALSRAICAVESARALSASQGAKT